MYAMAVKKSKGKEVQEFLDELKDSDIEKFKIAESARQIIFATYPKVSERFIYGGIMFALEKDFGGLYVSKYHVSYVFAEGYKLKDPKGLLEGGGKFRRHLKLGKIGDAEEK